MNQRSIVMILILFALIVIGMFSFAYLQNQEAITVEDTPKDQTIEPADRYAAIDRIDAKHYFIDGVHTVVGELALPTPCDLLETEAVVRESNPEQVQLNFSVINNADTCIQQITAARFQVSATASQEAVFSAQFAGRSIILNLIEAAPGESPDDFELYLKG